ncbi:MAG: uroporphyrinogen-III C-methyltransferase [Chloroflexi bacterium]|nr:uroporphyrinogen-III C-methyltransferase [Chloroflexota bacterium]
MTATHPASPGTVYLVGAGPGDPGLITVRGRQLLQQADVVIYDRLVDSRLLRYAKPGAERISVGKARGAHSATQESINDLLVRKAKEGKVVVRLKGGDPFVFGRGGEEAEALAQAGIRFAIVPGISSAIAAPAYAGIPVTHREASSSFTVVSGTGLPNATDARRRFTTADGTIVALMAWEGLEELTAALLREGRSPETPAALVQWGTEPHQRVVTATLGDIRQRGLEANLTAPVVLVVGEVVRLRKRLAWFEERPLFGRRILVTSSRQQASGLIQRLEEAGAMAVDVPLLEFTLLEKNPILDRAIAELSRYGWLVFSSPVGVEFFFARLKALGKDSRALAGAKVCAIGSATVAALNARGIEPDAVPADFSIAAVTAAVQEHATAGEQVLLHRAEEGGKSLGEAFAQMGARVREVDLYATKIPPGVEADLKAALANGVDAVTLTSSAAVYSLTSLAGSGGLSLGKSLLACLGPATAQSAKQQGLQVDVLPERHTTQALVEALSARFKNRD